jgi:hypothetical protein
VKADNPILSDVSKSLNKRPSWHAVTFHQKKQHGLERSLSAAYRHALERRTPQEEFSNFAQRLKNRQGTKLVNFESLLKRKAEIDRKLSIP